MLLLIISIASKIRITIDGIVKLTGYTSLSHKMNLTNYNVVRLWLRAPELFLEYPYNEKIDIWAIG